MRRKSDKTPAFPGRDDLLSQVKQTISSMKSQITRDHDDLMSKFLDHRAALQNIHGIVQSIETRMEATSNFHLKAMNYHNNVMNISVINLRSVGEQILSFLNYFPSEIRSLLQSIVRANRRTYQAVLQIQEHLSQSPTSLHDSNIRFTDALGEYRELPYEFFSHWEVCTPLVSTVGLPMESLTLSH